MLLFHLNIVVPERTILRSNSTYRERIDDDLFDLDLVTSHLDEGMSAGDGYQHGTLCGVRYVHFDYTGDQVMVLDRVLDAGPEPLIMDLRHMGGGDSTWALTAVGRLTDAPVPIFRTRTRNGPEHDDFDDWTTWDLRPRGDFDDRPVVVLTDRYVISAAERMVLALRELPQVTVMGTPTNGAQATLTTHVLENNWVLMHPVQELEGVDGLA